MRSGIEQAQLLAVPIFLVASSNEFINLCRKLGFTILEDMPTTKIVEAESPDITVLTYDPK